VGWIEQQEEEDEMAAGFKKFELKKTRSWGALLAILFLIVWKNWLMTSKIVGSLILGVDFYNIYLIFLHTKNQL
jgi:hypothetical protein